LQNFMLLTININVWFAEFENGTRKNDFLWQSKQRVQLYNSYCW
jgi:hypothetical protein